KSYAGNVMLPIHPLQLSIAEAYIPDFDAVAERYPASRIRPEEASLDLREAVAKAIVKLNHVANGWTLLEPEVTHADITMPERVKFVSSLTEIAIQSTNAFLSGITPQPAV